MHVRRNRDAIFLVAAGVCFVLAGIAYSWIPKPKKVAFSIFLPLATWTIFTDVSHSVYHSYYPSAILALILVAAVLVARSIKKKKVAG